MAQSVSVTCDTRKSKQHTHTDKIPFLNNFFSLIHTARTAHLQIECTMENHRIECKCNKRLVLGIAAVLYLISLCFSNFILFIYF